MSNNVDKSVFWHFVKDVGKFFAKKTEIPTKLSQLQNDINIITTETDPTVPDWAKSITKPTYTADEVGAVSKNQGTENANKLLGTNSSGQVVAMDMEDSSSGETTDISLGITGAAVGQTVRITAVNENGVPTAWEPVDVLAGGDGTWRTIAEIQTDGTVNQYEITQDADGNPLNLTEMIIRYVGLKGETVNNYQSVWINDVQVSYRHALNTTAATKYETFWMRKTGKYIYGICNEATKDGISGMNTSWRAGGIYLSSEVFPNDEGIQKIRLGNSYAAGTDYLNGITITILGK